MKQPLIRLSHVSKYYKTKTGVSEGMRDVSLDFYNNEFVAITGESGSGKTTLLNVISGLDSYEDGELYYNGLETSHFSLKDFESFRAKNIAFIFQNYNVIDSYSVYDNIVIALIAQNYPKKQIKSRALELLEKVGLTTHKNHITSKLSGGQKQKVVIARALAIDVPIILADEPTGNLDNTSSLEILTLLKEISKEKLVIMVSHNLKEVDQFATRKIVMHDGNIKNQVNLVKTRKKTNIDNNLNEDYKNKNSFQKGFKIALKNIIRTPKRSLFTLFLFSVVLFSFLFFYSSLLVNFTNSLAFSTESEFKIALIKRDGSSFSYAELDAFATNNKINRYFDLEFKVVNNLPENFEGREFERYRYFYNPSLASSVREENLMEGNLPINNNQILIDSSTKHFFNLELGGFLEIEGFNFEVSGIVRQRRNHISIYRSLYLFDEFVYDSNLTIKSEASAFISEDVKFNKIVFSSLDYQDLKLFKKNINQSNYQIIDNYLIIEKQMEFVVSSVKLILWVVLIFILQVIFLVLYQVQKNLMKSRKKDFSVYRSIGISETSVSFMILFEQLIMALIASLLVISSLLILKNYIPFVYKIVRNITFLNYLLAVLLFTIFSLRLGQKFNKKIFDLTVIEALREDK